VTRILYSKNDLFLYSASFDQNIIVWNLKSQEIIHKIAAHSDPINNIAVTSDGRTLMSCSDDLLIRFWDLASGKKLFEFRVGEKIEAIAFSPDGAYFAAGGDKGYIRQWDMISQQPRTDPIPVKKRIWSLEYVGDNKLLAGIDDGEYKSYNASQQSYDGTSRNFKIIEPPLSLYKIFGSGFKFDSYTASDSAGNALVSIRWDGAVKNGGTQILPPVYDNLDRLDISSDGTKMAVSGPRGMTAVWETDENRLLYLDTARLPFGDPISPDASSIIVDAGDYYQSIGLSKGPPLKKYFGLIPDGLISYADEGNILIAGNLTNSRVWDYTSGYETYYSAHPDNGCRLTLSQNTGEILQINSAAGVFLTWNETEKKVCAKSLQYRNTLSALSMNHKVLVYLGANGMIEGVDPVANKLLWRVPEKETTVLAVSPDGNIVVVGTSMGKMIFIDSRTGNAISEIMGNFGSLNAIEFSEDGMKIVTTGYDGTVRLFGVVQK
jgi:WD40 repeat protein